MKAICPKNKNHKEFVTIAHVSEEWVVDENGNWTSTVGSIETISKPNSDNVWTCNVCGSTALVEG